MSVRLQAIKPKFCGRCDSAPEINPDGPLTGDTLSALVDPQESHRPCHPCRPSQLARHNSNYVGSRQWNPPPSRSILLVQSHGSCHLCLVGSVLGAGHMALGPIWAGRVPAPSPEQLGP